MDLNGLPKTIPKTGGLRRPVKQLNTVTRCCGESPVALSGHFGINSGKSSHVNWRITPTRGLVDASFCVDGNDMWGCRKVHEKTLRYDPANVEAHYDVGLVLEAMGLDGEAAARLTEKTRP